MSRILPEWFTRRKRRRSSIEGLVIRTASIARAYSEVELDRTEKGLEEEIRRESHVPPPEYKIRRIRRKGEMVLHSKHVLMAVVILNLIDCVLVLGELMLDIHYLKELIKKADASSVQFIKQMESRYPEHIHGYDIDHMEQLYEKIYSATCRWNKTTPVHSVHELSLFGHHRRRAADSSGPVTESEVTYSVTSHSNYTDRSTPHHYSPGHSPYEHAHSIWESIAHGLHKASITILGILAIENILKIICMGRSFFNKKLEVFDCVVVIVSFIIDLVFLKGLSALNIEDAVLVLSFLLPWRVIRVVNSLIVAVLDHEHFRLKMLYQEKKSIASELKILKEKEKRFDFYLHKIEKFCESEGIPKWKIRQFTAMGRKQSTITSMASLALGSMLTGMIHSHQDLIGFAKSMSSQSQDSGTSGTSLDVISENEDTEQTTDRQGASNGDSETDAMLQNGLIPERNNNDSRPAHAIRPVSRKRVSFDSFESKPALVRQYSVHDPPNASPENDEHVENKNNGKPS